MLNRSAVFARFQQVVEAFRASRSGAVHVIFAVALVPVTLAIGAAVDYGRANQIKADLQSALDSAVLAGAIEAAGGTPTVNIPKIVENYVAANFKVAPAQVESSADPAGIITGTATLLTDTVFLRVMGVSYMNVKVTSQAVWGSGKAEIALALDTTGSMAGAKMTAAQKAASGLIDTLFAAPSAAQNVRVAIVPFTTYVNVGLQYRTAAWITGANDYSTTSNQCWNEYPNAKYSGAYTVKATCYADGSPYDCSYTAYSSVKLGKAVKVCSTVTSTYTWYGCVGSRNYPADLSDTVSSGNPVPALLNYWCSQPLTRLTNSPSTLKTQINSLTADGETYIAPGLLWAWRAISPNPPFADGVAAKAGVNKVVVLMTDGANTHSPNYPDHENWDVTAANKLTAETCTNIKAAGIRIMTIAFAVTDAAIKNILSTCATTGMDYYDASDINAMTAAFKSIGAKLAGVRLSK